MRIIFYLLIFALVGCASSPSTDNCTTESTEVCQPVNKQQISTLFDRWNRSLQTGDPRKVVANYAKRSVLLPTVSNKPRITAVQKESYFSDFLKNKPVGKIDSRTIEIGCNIAVDSGLYTFTYGTTGAKVKARYTYTYNWNGQQWLITSHHSSMLPESN